MVCTIGPATSSFSAHPTPSSLVVGNLRLSRFSMPCLEIGQLLWVKLAILGFEGGLLRQGILFVGLCPDARQFGLYVMAHAPGDSLSTPNDQPAVSRSQPIL